MSIPVFAAIMVLIAIVAFAGHQIPVAVLATALLMAGLFIHRYQDHPAVREWMERYF